MTSMALPPGMHKMLLKELETKNTRPKSAPTEAEEEVPCPPPRKQPAFEAIHNFLGVVQSTSPHLYLHFSDLLKKPAFTTFFLSTLFSKAYSLEIGDERTVNPSELMRQNLGGDQSASKAGSAQAEEKESANMVAFKQSVIHTMLYVCLFYKFDANQYVLKNLLSLWQNVSADKGRIVSANDSNSIPTQVARIVSSNYLDTKEGNISLMDMACNAENFRHSNEVVLDSSSARNLSSKIILEYFKTSLDHGIKVDAIYECLVTLLRHPLIGTGRLLCLLQTLKDFLMIRSPNASTIQLLIQVIRPFYLWPLPFGSAAKEALQMLSNELKVPGHSLRQSFFSEYPALRPATPFKGYRDQGITMFVNQESVFGKEFTDYLSWIHDYEPTQEQLMASLLSDAFENILGVPSGTIPFWTYSTQQLTSFYADVLATSNGIFGLEPSVASEERISQFTALKNKILSETPQAPATPRPPQLKPKLPYLYLDVQPIPDEKLESVSTHRTALCPVLSCSQYLQYMFKNSITTARQKGWTGDSPLPIRVAIAGNDVSLHRMICAFYFLKVTQPELFLNTQPRFFILPVGPDNQLAAYLASRDPWYLRTVYYGIPSALKIIPSLNGKITRKVYQANKSSSEDLLVLDEMFINASKEDENAFQNISSASIMRSSLDTYMRQAEQIYHVSVFQCECYVVSEEKDAPEEKKVIPFIQSIELLTGLSKSASLAGSMKAGKVMVSEIGVKYTQISVGGVTKTTTFEPKPYQTISISKVPKSSDKQRPSDRFQLSGDPSQSTLDVVLTEFETKKKSKSKGSFVELPSNYLGQVSMIELNTGERNRGFEIVIDEQTIGTFHRIVISEAKLPGPPESGLTFPVATFFPIQ